MENKWQKSIESNEEIKNQVWENLKNVLMEEVEKSGGKIGPSDLEEIFYKKFEPELKKISPTKTRSLFEVAADLVFQKYKNREQSTPLKEINLKGIEMPRSLKDVLNVNQVDVTSLIARKIKKHSKEV